MLESHRNDSLPSKTLLRFAPYELNLPIFEPAFRFSTPQSANDTEYAARAARSAWEDWKKATGKDQLDILIFVRSLPYPESRLTAYELAEAANIRVSRVVTLGDDCSTVVDAIIFAAQSVSLGTETVLVVVADRFSSFVDAETIRQKRDSADWKDAASTIAIGHTHTRNFQIRSLVSASNPFFNGLATIQKSASGYALRFNHDDRFLQQDVDSEYLVIRLALGDIAYKHVRFVMTNRSTARHEAIKIQLCSTNEAIFYSRSDVGHTGGSDLIFNLQRAISATPASELDHILISANGLGYTWKSLLIGLTL